MYVWMGDEKTKNRRKDTHKAEMCHVMTPLPSPTVAAEWSTNELQEIEL